jgi:hypothetical protein
MLHRWIGLQDLSHHCVKLAGIRYIESCLQDSGVILSEVNNGKVSQSQIGTLRTYEATPSSLRIFRGSIRSLLIGSPLRYRNSHQNEGRDSENERVVGSRVGSFSADPSPIRNRRFFTTLTLAAVWLSAEFFRVGRGLRYGAFCAFALSFALLSLTSFRWSWEWYW